MSSTTAPRKPDPTAASKERNEYIPSFISQKPFYVAEDADLSHSTTTTAVASDYLEHQRLAASAEQARPTSDQSWATRNLKKSVAATKYRKGACKNCGAMGHTQKECLSRPRKKGACWTGKDIEADVHVSGSDGTGWDAKRDRWKGYDVKEHQAAIEQVNEMRQLQEHGGTNGETADGDEDDADDELKHGDTEMTSKKGQKQLRIREDTAKYLLNLDLDSAKYDPKTRRMIDEGATADKASQLVAEEGFVRQSGDAAKFEHAQRSAWDSQEAGQSGLHLQANPTGGEYFRRKEQEEQARKKEEQKKLLAERYGSQEQFKSDKDAAPAVVENERFVEYDERGRVKVKDKTQAKSSYAEDVLINNHTSVWGSWWADFKWGYACCHSTVKNSYCAGDEGKQKLLEAPREDEDVETQKTLRESVDAKPTRVPREEAWREEERREEFVPNGVEAEEKSRQDSSARKRSIEQTGDGDDVGGVEEGRRKRVAAAVAA